MLKKLRHMLVVTCLVSGLAHAQAIQKNTSVLFIQNAQSSELSADTKQVNGYRLTLHKPQLYVSYFSDRPERITGILPVQKFLQFWDTKNKAGFRQDPPNVALESSQITLIGTLTDPQYLTKSGDISYHFTPLNGAHINLKLSRNLGFTALFIDDIGWDPGGFGDGN